MEMQMEGDFIASVVLTGLTVVFLGLVILIFFVFILGKIFTALKSAKSKKTTVPTTTQTQSIPQAEKAPAPVVANGISEEIVAVISAAVASMCDDNSKLVLKSIKKSSANSRGRRAWGRKGIAENTSSF